MVYKAGRRLSKKEIDLFENAQDIREIQYLGVRLVDEQCKYNPKEIAEYAVKKGYASRLGYLAEISLEAARNLETEKSINLTKKANCVKELIEILYSHRNINHVFLFPYKNNDYHKNVLRKLAEKRSTHELNKKWKIYSATHSPDIEDYIELYLIDLRQGNCMKVFRPRRKISKKQLERNFKEFMGLVYSS